MKSKSPGLLLIILFFILNIAGGCALTKPSREFDETTLIDWGLVDSFKNSVAVRPFQAEDPKWGIYAAQRMKEYLLEEKAFHRVIYAEKIIPDTTYVVTGSLDHISYGGTDTPTSVFLTVRLTAVSDDQTRFLRTAKASSVKGAYHVALLRRIFVPAPYPEGVMNSVLRHIAKDISARTNSSPPVQDP
jgi:hypothetical protein